MKDCVLHVANVEHMSGLVLTEPVFESIIVVIEDYWPDPRGLVQLI